MSKIFIGLVVLLGLIGCSQKTQVETIADLESKYTELNTLSGDIDKERNALFTTIREFNANRPESEQFDIASIDTLLGAPEKDLLRTMFKEEQDFTYNGLLKNIIAKNEEIISLNSKITELGDQIVSLENQLPKAYVVQKGDTHYQIVRDFLVNQKGMDLKQAKEIAWKTVMTDNLLPGNKIWLSYNEEEGVIGTFVTQGSAKIAPMRYEQIAKKQMIQKAIERATAQATTVSVQNTTTASM